MKNNIKAEIIAHSKRAGTGDEIITYKLTYPRIIHSEILTYHMMSVNSASSRAIPVNKLIGVIEETPFYPISYQRKHSGMQGSSYFTSEEDIKTCDSLWKESMQESIKVAKKMLDFGVSKQIINRTLESYQYHCCLMTGTRESFEHLFEQRCPIYNVENLKFISKKDAIFLFPSLKDLTDLEWLQRNSGQAEIHFMDLAEKMYDALDESTPDMLKDGDWHIPFQEEIWKGKKAEKLEDFIKMSCAMTARISYTTISDNEILTLEKAKNIYDKCVKSGHFSVVSHCAKCMTYEEYENWYKGFMKTTYYFDENGRQHRVMADRDFHKAKGYNKNLRGFISLRQYVEDGKEITN